MAKLKENVNHVDFNEASVIEAMHLAAYASHCSSPLRRSVWKIPKNHITDGSLECFRYSTDLTEYGFRNNSEVIMSHFIRHNILKNGTAISSYGRGTNTYILVDVEKSRKIALPYAKVPPKAAYRTCWHHQTGVPVGDCDPRYTVHICEHTDDYELVQEGYYRHVDRHEDATKEQLRKYLQMYIGNNLWEFLKIIKAKDVKEDLLRRIINTVKANAPLLINVDWCKEFMKVIIKERDLFDYDVLFPGEAGTPVADDTPATTVVPEDKKALPSLEEICGGLLK